MKFETKAIHVGEEPNLREGGSGDVVVAIHLSSTFARKEVEKPTGGYEYSRSGNPTRDALEKRLAALENARFARIHRVTSIKNPQESTGSHLQISNLKNVDPTLKPLPLDPTLKPLPQGCRVPDRAVPSRESGRVTAAYTFSLRVCQRATAL